VAYRLAELAELVGGRIEGDPEHVVEAIRTLDAAGPRDLSFLTHSRYRAQALASAAGALLVGPDFPPELQSAPPGVTRHLLIAGEPSLALARLMERLGAAADRSEPGVQPWSIRPRTSVRMR
jgi:UDP-3-O-[3-hydroxymyristoyl] glucosamine N-acyltransferase